MRQYLLAMYQPDGDPPPPEILGPIMERVAAIRTEMEDSGALVHTAGLHPPSSATVVRAQDGDILVTDGPFAEAREHIGGFTLHGCRSTGLGSVGGAQRAEGGHEPAMGVGHR